MFGKFVLPFAVVLAALSLHAETVVFRGGEVLAAELSSRKPSVANLPAAETAQTTAYALVTVRLQPGRTISIEDYSLSALGGMYRCVAVREENGPFDAAKWHWDTASPKKKYGMLFALQIPAGQNYRGARFGLVCNAPGKWPRTELVFTDRGSNAFTAAGSIPANGAFPAPPKQ